MFDFLSLCYLTQNGLRNAAVKLSPMVTRLLSYALSYLLDQDCQAVISGEGFVDQSDLQSTLALGVHGA